MVTIVTESGRRKELPANLEVDRVVGLDGEGRIVVNDFDAFNSEPTQIGGYTMQPFLFGLTLCCSASDKGVEDGIVCRACYGYEETGNYIYRNPDGSFDYDPIKEVIR